jgi:hypothetical protein
MAFDLIRPPGVSRSAFEVTVLGCYTARGQD